MALISGLMYVNCSCNWGSLFISVSNMNDAGSQRKGKQFTLRCVSIFTYKTFMIPVLVPPYIYSRLPGLRVFYWTKNSRYRVKVRLGLDVYIGLLLLHKYLKHFTNSNFTYIIYNKTEKYSSSWLTAFIIRTV
jgi:hypothetical protein